MVDQSDLDAVMVLNAEISNLALAIDILANDGRIVSMQVSSPEGEVPGRTTGVTTANMVYPPQMIDAIVAQMQTELDRLNSQLSSFGVSGVPTSPRTASRKR